MYARTRLNFIGNPHRRVLDPVGDPPPSSPASVFDEGRCPGLARCSAGRSRPPTAPRTAVWLDTMAHASSRPWPTPLPGRPVARHGIQSPEMAGRADRQGRAGPKTMPHLPARSAGHPRPRPARSGIPPCRPRRRRKWSKSSSSGPAKKFVEIARFGTSAGAVPVGCSGDLFHIAPTTESIRRNARDVDLAIRRATAGRWAPFEPAKPPVKRRSPTGIAEDIVAGRRR